MTDGPVGSRRVEVSDVEYGRAGDDRLLARLYRPVGAPPTGCVVTVHGGTWVRGSRLNDAFVAEQLAEAGTVVVSLDFRMPPRARYPETVADVNLGVRWVKAQARRWSIDPGSVGGVGFSSGGHLLMLSAMRPADPRYRRADPRVPDEVTAELAFVVLCYAVLSPHARYAAAHEWGRDDLIDGHDRFWPDPASQREGDPRLILARGEPVTLPPALLIQGLDDRNIGPSMSADFAAAYHAAGAHAKLLELPGSPHGFLRRHSTDPAAHRSLAAIAAFVAEHGTGADVDLDRRPQRI